MAEEITFSFDDVPAFGRAMREAAPKFFVRELGKAFYQIGKSDNQKMKQQLQSSGLNIRSKGFLNSFKFKASDSREAKSISDLSLNEYTGAKPFRIFQDGGTITPSSSRLLTILTDAARTAGGKRKFSQKELEAMIASGQAKIIQTKAGPAIIKVDNLTTKSGRYKKGAKLTILAWLKPRVAEKKRIDFFANFESNGADHERILSAAADAAIEKTIADEGD